MLKWNPCRNDNSKTVYGVTKSPPGSVSDEKVQANRDRVYFQHLYLWLTTKKSLLTLDIHYLRNGDDFEGLILLKFINFHKKCVALKIRLEIRKSRIFTKWIGHFERYAKPLDIKYTFSL